MKIRESVLANSLALTMGVVYFTCAILIGIFPEVSKTVAISWFHGMDLGKIWTGAARGNFTLGLITTVAGSWLVGYLFAFLYNKMNKTGR